MTPLRAARNADARPSQTTAIFPGIFAAEFSLTRVQTMQNRPACAERAVSRLRAKFRSPPLARSFSFLSHARYKFDLLVSHSRRGSL